jgi:DNA helicase II / ATP-dependent DNA helicase PcrA
MFSKLSYSQKRIVVCNEPRIIVKACPGSGKTYSVTARLARLLKCNRLSKHQGIAALSFTNTACDEIRKGLKENFGINDFGYPNYVGTIDSFVNNFIFLPYGHLVMNCNDRPEIVGTEFNKWYEFDASKRHSYSRKISDPNFYFDKVSFNMNNELLRLFPYQTYIFGKGDWDIQKKVNGEYKKVISDLIEVKKIHFKKGKAIQADANYFANKILKNYPLISNNLAKRFPILMIDEAQDTTEIQMSIIDTLDKSGVESIILVGDPNQAIFEWNTADAELFNEKYESKDWFKLKLIENRRCSSNICNALNCFFQDSMTSISQYKDYSKTPKIIGYNLDNSSILDIYCSFIDNCNELFISDENLAVVYRGRSFGELFFGFANENLYDENSPWESKFYYVRDIIHGKYLIEKGILKNGFKLIEKGYHKWKNGLPYISSNYLREEVNKFGYKKYRELLFTFLNELPDIYDKNLITWITEVKQKTGYDFKIKFSKGNIPIPSLFHSENSSHIPFYINTIHSVKGKSFDAVLLFLRKDSATKDYKNLINTKYKESDVQKNKKDKEEIRIVYVACSRPRKLLWIAVPYENVELWTSFLSRSN